MSPAITVQFIENAIINEHHVVVQREVV